MKMLAFWCISKIAESGYYRYVHMEQHGSHRTDFHEIRYLRIFRISVQKMQVLLKSGNDTAT